MKEILARQLVLQSSINHHVDTISEYIDSDQVELALPLLLETLGEFQELKEIYEFTEGKASLNAFCTQIGIDQMKGIQLKAERILQKRAS